MTSDPAMSGSSNSNLPPPDYLAVALEAERLAVWVDAQLVAFDARCAALLAGYETFESKTAGGIPNEDIAERATVLRAQIHKQLGLVEAAREAIKAPVLAAARLIDGAARGRTAPLSAARATIDQRAAVFMAAKVEAARAAADVAAVLPSDADLSRVRSAYGPQGSLKTSLDIRVLNVDDVPEQWLKPREVDIQRVLAAGVAAEKARKQLPAIPGIEFIHKHGVTMRG